MAASCSDRGTDGDRGYMQIACVWHPPLRRQRYKYRRRGEGCGRHHDLPQRTTL